MDRKRYTPASEGAARGRQPRAFSRAGVLVVLQLKNTSSGEIMNKWNHQLPVGLRSSVLFPYRLSEENPYTVSLKWSVLKDSNSGKSLVHPKSHQILHGSSKWIWSRHTCLGFLLTLAWLATMTNVANDGNCHCDIFISINSRAKILTNLGPSSVGEHLPSTHKALDSAASPAHKQTKNRGNVREKGEKKKAISYRVWGYTQSLICSHYLYMLILHQYNA